MKPREFPMSGRDLKTSEVFCVLPWIHLSVQPDGKVLPCCASPWDRPAGNLHDSTLEQVWNSPVMRELRRDMLDGTPNPRCGYCYERQEARIPSHREIFNERFAHHIIPETVRTRPDGSLEKLRLLFMDIRFSNVCNFRCRMCGPHASSSWHDDAAKLWENASHEKLLTPTTDPSELWRQIEPLIPDLEEICFAGGEPLLMDEHYQILNLLVDKGLTGVRIRYNTNFSVMSHKGQDVMALWDRFRDVEVAASLDGLERRGEYLRKGIIWDQVLRNRERLRTACPRVNFRVRATLNIMNSLHLPDMHARLLETGFIEPGEFWFHHLSDPEEYRVQVLPKPLKTLAAEKFERHAETLLRAYDSRIKGEAQAFASARSFFEAEDRTNRLPQFRERTAKLDEMRGESFADVFPELAELTR
jgi:MoaA/NifB/PqqE/SkfB family radical SAM enzyme